MLLQSITPEEERHLLQLTRKFISPYRVLHMLDPIQADHFSSRNGHSCSHHSSHSQHEHSHNNDPSPQAINIPSSQLTPNEKLLAQLLSPHQLKAQLPHLLAFAHQKYTKVIEGGRRDSLVLNSTVEKYLLDQVMAESLHQFTLQALTQQIRSQSQKMHQEIGLWATNASWQQQYPHFPLDNLDGRTIGSLLQRGWGVQDGYLGGREGVRGELRWLEKDGQFEESDWLNQQKVPAKVLHDPYKFTNLHNTTGQQQFPSMHQAILLVSSLPFELNVKANLFCTASPNLHFLYSAHPFQTQEALPLTFAALLGIGTDVDIEIGGVEEKVKGGTLLLVDCRKEPTIKLLTKKGEVFLLRSYIGTVTKQ